MEDTFETVMQRMWQVVVGTDINDKKENQKYLYVVDMVKEAFNNIVEEGV